MSRRIWDTEDGFEVATGWDPPLSHFFLDIKGDCPTCGGAGHIFLEGEDNTPSEENMCVVCDGTGEKVVYDNLDDTSASVDRMGGIHDLDYIKLTLDKYLTAWPSNILNILYIDQDRDLANAQSNLGTFGKLKSP